MKSLGYSFCLSSPTVKRHHSPPAREKDPPKATPTPDPPTKPQPEPTSKIREIIKQYNSRPPPESKPFEPTRSVSTPLPVRSIHTSPDLISCWIPLGPSKPVILHHQCFMDAYMCFFIFSGVTLRSQRSNIINHQEIATAPHMKRITINRLKQDKCE